MSAKSLQFCLTLCRLRDCSPPGSSVHGTFQPRILEWVAIPFSRRSSQIKPTSLMSPVSAGRFFTTSATWEAQHRYRCNIDLIYYLFRKIPGHTWNAINMLASVCVCSHVWPWFMMSLIWKPMLWLNLFWSLLKQLFDYINFFFCILFSLLY